MLSHAATQVLQAGSKGSATQVATKDLHFFHRNKAVQTRKFVLNSAPKNFSTQTSGDSSLSGVPIGVLEQSPVHVEAARQHDISVGGSNELDVVIPNLVQVSQPDNMEGGMVSTLEFDVAQIIADFQNCEQQYPAYNVKQQSQAYILAGNNLNSSAHVGDTIAAGSSVNATVHVQDTMPSSVGFQQSRIAEPEERMGGQSLDLANSNPVCLCHLPWLPRLPLAFYINLPDVHYHLWNIPINSPRVRAHLFIEDFAQVPHSVFKGQYCTHKVTHKALTMFNQVLCWFEQYVHHLTKEPLGSGQLVIVYSHINPTVLAICKAALLTCRGTRKLTDYHMPFISHSFVVCNFSANGEWCLGHINIHLITGVCFTDCKIIVFHYARDIL